MKRTLIRLRIRIRKLTRYIRSRFAAGLKAPVAKANRDEARKSASKLQRKIRSLRIDWNGHEPVQGRTLRKAVRIALAEGLVVTSTTGGTHTATSYHYQGRAVDLGSGSVAQMERAQKAIVRKVGVSNLTELFGPANTPWVKNGVGISGAEGSALENLHDNHVHVAV